MIYEEAIIGALKSRSPTENGGISRLLFEKIGTRSTVIYGAGAFGGEMLGYMQANGIQPTCFLDAFKSGLKSGIEIIHPEMFHDKSVIVVLALVLDKNRRAEVVSALNKYGYDNIFDGQEIRAHYVHLEGERSLEYLNANTENILRPLSYLSDDESRLTYSKNIVAHLTRSYGGAAETDCCEQYYLSPVLNESRSVVYVDCGAYNGDTFRRLVQRKVNISHYIGFEPIPENYSSLAKAVKQCDVEATLFPLAVSNEPGFGRFRSLLGSSCAALNGDTEVQYARIDDVIQNKSVGFMKMDIEGDEPLALEGALKLIDRYVPELAISVYHKINHFWEIPNRLHQLDLGYHLYMRTHSSACMETVLYANKSLLT